MPTAPSNDPPPPVIKQQMERILLDTLHFSVLKALSLPLRGLAARCFRQSKPTSQSLYFEIAKTADQPWDSLAKGGVPIYWADQGSGDFLHFPLAAPGGFWTFLAGQKCRPAGPGRRTAGAALSENAPVRPRPPQGQSLISGGTARRRDSGCRSPAPDRQCPHRPDRPRPAPCPCVPRTHTCPDAWRDPSRRSPAPWQSTAR